MPGFLSLPREIRDKIYGYSVICEAPISLYTAQNFKSSALAKMDGLKVALVHPFSGGIALEARDTFRRINRFTVHYPALHPSRPYAKCERIPRALFGPDAWIRHAVIILPSQDQKTPIENRISFLRALASVPHLQTLGVQIYRSLGDLHNTATKFLEIAKVCIELKTHFGKGFEFRRMGVQYNKSDDDPVEEMLLTDLSWVFSPMLALQDGARCEKMTNLSLKDLIPEQLAGMSVLRKAYRRRDKAQDDMAMLILMVAYALKLEGLKEGTQSWYVLHLKGKLRVWFKKHRLEAESAQMTKFLDKYVQLNFHWYSPASVWG